MIHHPSLVVFAIRNRVRSLKPVAELVVARWEAPEGMQVATGAQQLPDKCFQQVYVVLFVLQERMLCILTLTRTSWANCHTTLMSNDFDIGI